jgi:hypothetical protein
MPRLRTVTGVGDLVTYLLGIHRRWVINDPLFMGRQNAVCCGIFLRRPSVVGFSPGDCAILSLLNFLFTYLYFFCPMIF